MGFLRINMGDDGLTLHQSGISPKAALDAQTKTQGPVIIMIHGYKFAPGDPSHCPHDHILSLEQDHSCWKARSWPSELGITNSASDCVGIAFGWPARGSIWAAYDRAAEAGERLAQLVTMIRHIMPDRPIHLMAHSLGARVALTALPHLPAQSIKRILLLAGAEFTTQATKALRSPAGRTTQVVAITSRENTAYDLLFETLIAKGRARVIGRDTPDLPNWTAVPIDRAETLSALATHGFGIAPRQSRICHWSSYLRPGIFTLYRSLIATKHPMPIATLRAILPHEETPSPWPLPAFVTAMPNPFFGQTNIPRG